MRTLRYLCFHYWLLIFCSHLRSNTAAIIVYQLSLSNELESLALGILETDSSKSTTPKTPPPVIADNASPVYEVTGPSKKPIALAYLSSEKA